MEEEGGEGWPYVTSEGNHSYWEKFHAKSDKKQKIFFYTPVSQFQKISTLNYLTETKKQDFKKRYPANFTGSRPEVYHKKGALKNFATC